ncbi:uncharacterized protein N7518_008180 [Penicillium psychrosexuale]|uniref:uncharacterized protein n=1 Tax=Penicillium psychrosexuale TaxID=1002107 RepID=UPI002545B479|nr:uncharacterized protein N7518_008180 [Penicillium psychrosexuale]KAJ5791169.1 hypothetical protein N7518_008180 [Penicillium psychrosexuale]
MLTHSNPFANIISSYALNLPYISYNICSLEGHHDTISCIKVEKNTIIARTQDGTICVWDLTKNNNNHASLILNGHTGAVLCLKLHGNYLVSGGHDGVARVWNIETGQCKDVLRSHERMRMQLPLLAHIGPTAQNQRSGGGCETLKNLRFKYIDSELLDHLHMVRDDLVDMLPSGMGCARRQRRQWRHCSGYHAYLTISHMQSRIRQ